MVQNSDGTMSVDEIATFIDARYVSASQAIGHIFGLPICEMSPSVQQLALHLPNEQSVLVRDNQSVQEALEKAENTMLTRYFQLNREDPEARKYCYTEILMHYSWNLQQKKFKKRKNFLLTASEATPDGPKSDQIGRLPMISLHKKTTELFHLRLLLHHVPGPQSFEDLRTVDGEVLDTFQAATVKLGLWEDDSECELCLAEAYSIKIGKAFIQCFVSVILHCMPSDPRSLYNKFKEQLAEHLKKQYKVEEATEEMHNSVLLEIKRLFENAGENMKSLNLPLPNDDMDQVFESEPRILQEEIDYCQPEMLEEAQTMLNGLNPEQKTVSTAVIEAVENEEGGLFVVDAPGGTGKTFMTSATVDYLRSKGHICIATAISGIASQLQKGGRTLHYKLAVPIKLHDKSYCKIKEGSPHQKLVQQASLLVIDEFTMGSRALYETVDRSLKHHRKSDHPFGGLGVLMTGDWRQTLPVCQGAGKAEILSQTLKASRIWKDHVKSFKLKTNMRLINQSKESTDFANYLMDIGNGTETVYPSQGENMVLIPKNLKSKAKNMSEFCDEIFPDLNKRISEGLLNEGIEGQSDWKEWLMSRYIICGTNEDCIDINDHLMSKLDGQARIYKSADKVLHSVDSDGRDNNMEVKYPTEFLNTLRSSSMPPHILILKPGCPIMLMRNMNPELGHCNGSRYVVKNLGSKTIYAELCTGPKKGQGIFIPRIPFQPEDKNIPVEFQRRQFPIRPSFAITSNKSQGQTAQQVGLYLKNDGFAHGQLYVALSRVGHPDRVKIFKPVSPTEKNPSDANLFMKNVVYEEILN